MKLQLKKIIPCLLVVTSIFTGCTREIDKKHSLCMSLDIPMTQQESFDYASALLLDLNNNGIVDTTAFDNSSAYFDFDGDGFKQKTVFAAKQDGVLVRDLNGDGLITSGKELFGGATTLRNGGFADNGFIALNELDSNGDHRITVEDPAYKELKVLADYDDSGIVKLNEFKTLEALGINAIDITCEVENRTDDQGNHHRQTSKYHTETNKTFKITNVWLQQNLTITQDQHVWIPKDIQGLPNAKGFGTSGSLHTAMFKDKSGQLKALVDAFINAETHLERVRLNEQIIFAWTQQPEKYSTYYQAPMDARRIGALEVFYGHRLPKPNGIGRQFAQLYNKQFDEFADSVFYQLSSQSFLKAYFEKALWSRDQLAQVYAGHYQKIVPLLFDLAYNDPVKAHEILRDFAKAVRGVDPYKPINVELLRKAIGDFISDGHMSQYSASSENLTLSALFGVSHSADVYVGNKVDNLAFGLGGNDLLYGKAGDDTLFGGAGYDELYGGVGKDSLNGGMHDDILSGEAGEDFLIGAQGDDILIAGLGDDTYQYSRGDGNDIINNFDLGLERKDTLFFGDGIEPSRVRVTRDQEDLVLVLIDHNHTVRLQYFYRSPFYEINQVIFSDGTRWSLVDLLKP
ncbi:MAG: calcium-binding protein [Pseudomonadota bacterium]|nr:calcium-binding protein [Pseudomonadota bacterium]